MRHLGINVPTALMAILGIGFTVVIVATFPGPEASDPKTESITGFLLWLIKSIAWIGALVAVFVPLMTWNIVQVARRDRSANAHLRMATESANSLDYQMKAFLRNSLGNPSYGVAKCYAFGSLVRLYPTRDVDIIIQFDTSKPRQVRTYRDRLRKIETLFQEFHDRKLHVQTFLCSENEALDRFLNDAGEHERIR